MNKSRMEAFSDGVIAIIITIMVLELRPPAAAGLEGLQALAPAFTSYALSFVFLGIYWNNHHHLLQAAHKVDGRILWANMHLLFWLSLVPFCTAWMGSSHFAPWPVALYGLDQLMDGVAFFLLVQALLRAHGKDSVLAKALGSDFKGKASVVMYLVALPLCLVSAGAAFAIYVAIAGVWLVPDRRFERVLKAKQG